MTLPSLLGCVCSRFAGFTGGPHVSSGPLEGIRQDGIRSVRDLLGKMPLKDEGEREQDQMRKPSDHGGGLIAAKEGREGKMGG